MNNVLDWMAQELAIANEEGDVGSDCTLQLAKLIHNYKKAHPGMNVAKVLDQLARLEKGHLLSPIFNNPEDWEYVDELGEYSHRRILNNWMRKGEDDSIVLYLNRFDVCDIGELIEDPTKISKRRGPSPIEVGFVEGFHPIEFPYFNEFEKGVLYVDCSVPGYEMFTHYKDECTGEMIKFEQAIKFNKDGDPEPVDISEFCQAYAKLHPNFLKNALADRVEEEDK